MVSYPQGNVNHIPTTLLPCSFRKMYRCVLSVLSAVRLPPAGGPGRLAQGLQTHLEGSRLCLSFTWCQTGRLQTAVLRLPGSLAIICKGSFCCSVLAADFPRISETSPALRLLTKFLVRGGSWS